MTLTRDHSPSSGVATRWALLALLALVLVAELAAIGVIFKHRIPFYCLDNWPGWACRSASKSLVSVYCVLGALAVTAMLRPAAFRLVLTESRLRALPFAVNLAGVLCAFVPLMFLVDGQARDRVAPAFAFWGLGMALIIAGLAFTVAPWPRWRQFLRETWSALLPAILAGAAAPWLATMLRPAWRSVDGLASATFGAVVRVMNALGYEVEAFPEDKLIGSGDFYIAVSQQCSGVEGLALVTVFVTLYLWLFRGELKFPHALLLYPVGLAASAGFNVIRIAVLLIIGLEGNPELAVGGFHSHAGWLMFTLVSLGIIAAAQTVPWIKQAGPREPTAARTDAAAAASIVAPPFWSDPVVARILPFAVFMLSALVASAFASAPGQVYPLRAVVVAAVMLPFYGLYRALDWRVDPGAIAIGVAIATLWVLVPVPAAESPPYGAMSGGLLLMWMVARGIGTTVLVPVLEEMFFRDYLEVRLRRGSGRAWSIGAALVSAGLFAVLHDRWIEAFVAGLLFSWLAARPGGRITDSILAHGIANGAIFAAALATGRFEII